MSSITELQKAQIPVFFGKIFQSRDLMHLAHLRTLSYAKHKALNSYYNDILDLLDTLIESYQGEFGIQTIEIPSSKYEDPVIHLKNLLVLIKSSIVLFKDTDYLNILDEMKTLIKQTLYKLENLK